jgi:hypothetical protein
VTISPSISSLITNVFSQYLDGTGKNPAGEPITRGNPTVALVQQQIPDSIRRILRSSGVVSKRELLVTGSVGTGRWTWVPWIAIFHPDETTSAMRGVYPVYLVASDMSGVYLTLNQGVTEPGWGGLSGVRATVSSAVGHLPGFMSGPLPKSALAVPRASKRITDYETGCILYKFYDAKAMPADSEIRHDLEDLVKAYVAWVESRPSVLAVGTTSSTTPAVTVLAEEPASVITPATPAVTALTEEPGGTPPPAATIPPTIPESDFKERLIQRVRELSPKGFELLVGELLRRLGYQDVNVTGRPNDHGIDGDFIVPIIDVKVAFQAKRYSATSNVSGREVRELVGSVVSRDYDRGVLVTTSNFTAAALEDADGAGSKIVLINSARLVDLLLSVNFGIHLVVERADLDEEAFRRLEDVS